MSYLEDVAPNKVRGQAIGLFLEDFQQVLLDVFKDQVQLPLAPKRLLQAHNVGLLQHAQDLDLAQSRLVYNLIVWSTTENGGQAHATTEAA